MKVINTITEIKNEIKKIKQQNLSIGLIPTMGYIHEAHLQLVSDIKNHSDISIVTIFVNPKQFNNLDDYKNYPHNLEEDIKKLKKIKADIIFTPNLQEIYPQEGFLTFKMTAMNDCLCANDRKNHFEGVITIIFKLFNIITPNYAIFGEKDFQQLQIIKRAIKEFNFDVKILSSPLLRQQDGLALSSRNTKLSQNNKLIALNIFKTLKKIKEKIILGENITKTLEQGKISLLDAGFDCVEYLDFRDEKKLHNLNYFNKKIPSRIFIAAKINNIRLIDNLKLQPEYNGTVEK